MIENDGFFGLMTCFDIPGMVGMVRVQDFSFQFSFLVSASGPPRARNFRAQVRFEKVDLKYGGEGAGGRRAGHAGLLPCLPAQAARGPF